MRQEGGLTVVELLIAAAILAVVLGSLGALLVSTNRAYEANRAVTSASGQLRSAIQALQYDLSLAGFCGVSSACNIPEPIALKMSSRPEGREVKVLEISYVETRYAASSVPQRVTYEVVDGKLLRSVGEGPASSIADGVRWIELNGYLDNEQTGGIPSYARPPTGRLAGLVLTVHALRNGNNASESFTVSLQNPL